MRGSRRRDTSIRVAAARQCLNAAERARVSVSAASGELRGRLSVGVIPTVAAVDVPSELKEFHLLHPAVRISLAMGSSVDLVARVVQGRTDVAFIGLPTEAAVPGVEQRVLARDRHVAVVAADHPLASASRVSLARLAKEVFVEFPSGGQGRAQTDQAFAEAGLARDVAFEVSDADLMARLIRQGLGVGLLPSTFAPQLRDLVTIPVTKAPTRVECLAWSRGGPSAPATAFLDQLDINFAHAPA